MHEYSLVQGVFEAAMEQVAKHKALSVASMKLEVGEFAFCADEALEHAWGLLIPGTPLEQCKLDIQRVRATMECPSCGYEGHAPVPPEAEEDHHHLPPLACPKCDGVPEIASGSGIVIRDMELEVEDK